MLTRLKAFLLRGLAIFLFKNRKKDTKVEFKEDDIFYRQVNIGFYNKKGELNPAAFKVREGEDGLSVDLERIIKKPEHSLIIAGKTYKTGSSIFKDTNKLEVYSLQYAFVQSMEYLKEIKHSPTNNNPEIIGTPNNPSHCDIINTNDDLVRVQLKRHAKKMEPIDRQFISSELNAYFKSIGLA